MTNRTMHRTLLAAALAAIAAVPVAPAWAQGPTKGSIFVDGSETGGSKPWQQFKLNKTKKVKLNFKNAGIDSVLQLFQDQSGITIVRDPSIKDPLTISSAKAVTLDEAFNILNTVLGLRGYQMVKNGDLLVIRPKDDNFGNKNQQQTNPFAGMQFPTQNNLNLRFYPIKYANAAEVARVINDVFATTPNQQNPFQQFFNRGRGPQRGRAAIIAGPGGLNLAGGQDEQQVKASSDDFSNSVIVNASDREQDQVKTIIEQIDRETDQPITSKVYPLQFASASDLAPIVQNVLSSNPPKGRGGQGNQQVPFGQQFGAALRFGTAAASFGNVVADTRTNSLVVSATSENLAIVDQVIKNLDKETPVSSTTFVFTLQNAKADDVASLLQSAFGNRQGVSGVGQQNQRQTNTAQQPNVSRPNTSGGANNAGGNRLGGLDQNTQDQRNLALALQDPNATSGDLLTSVAVQGGFQRGGGGFFGGGQQNGQTQATTGRDAQGRLVNTLDLTGQVTVIPDINTNSVIIVAPPNSINIIKSILDQLDKLPEQVMIDTVIVEASLTKENQFGLEWKFAQSKLFGDPSKSGVANQTFGIQNSTTPNNGFNYTLAGGDLSAFFNILQTDTRFDVLSTPKIFTTNNVQATINVSQSIPYVLSTIQDATTGALSYNYGFENVGIVLTVTPRVTSNGYVQLDIDQQANDLEGYTSFNAPIVDQREATTRVSVKDQHTVILGGIIRSQVSATVNKIPLLGDLPILGSLFRHSDKTVDKTELLIFLTPHIISGAADATDVKNQTINQTTPRTQKMIQDVLKTGSVVNGGGEAPPKPTKKSSDSH